MSVSSLADGEEAAIGADEVDHGSPSVRVAHGRDDVGGLVQQHVGVRIGRDGTPVERDVRAVGYALSRRRGDDAVDRHAPVRDERLDTASRAQSARREVAVEARGLGAHRNRCVGLELVPERARHLARMHTPEPDTLIPEPGLKPRSAATAWSLWRRSGPSSSSPASMGGRPSRPSSSPKMRSKIVVVR